MNNFQNFCHNVIVNNGFEKIEETNIFTKYFKVQIGFFNQQPNSNDERYIMVTEDKMIISKYDDFRISNDITVNVIEKFAREYGYIQS